MLDGEKKLKELEAILSDERKALGAAEIAVAKLQNALTLKEEEIVKLNDEIDTKQNVRGLQCCCCYCC